MYNVVKELLNKDSNPVPNTDNTMYVVKCFGEFFIDKVNKIRNEVDKCAMSMSDNVQMFDVSCNESDDISFDQFANVSDELLQVIAKCPNKSCVLVLLPTWLLTKFFFFFFFFFVTRLTKGGGVVVATSSLDFPNRSPMKMILVSVGRYRSSLLIHTKMSTIGQGVT